MIQSKGIRFYAIIGAWGLLPWICWGAWSCYRYITKLGVRKEDTTWMQAGTWWNPQRRVGTHRTDWIPSLFLTTSSGEVQAKQEERCWYPSAWRCDSRLGETKEGNLAASGGVVGPGVAPSKKRGQLISNKLQGILPDTLHLPSDWKCSLPYFCIPNFMTLYG